MRNIKRLVLLACLLLTACATSAIKGTKVDANAEPVRDLSVVIWLADISSAPKIETSDINAYTKSYKAALENQFPQIFQINGVPVISTLVEDGRSVPKPLPGLLLDGLKSSHLLVLTPEAVNISVRLNKRTSYPRIIFGAELWDAKRGNVVWKANPYLDLVDYQPLPRTRDMAGQLLNALQADGLVMMKQKNAVGLSGKPIEDASIWEANK